MTYLIFHIKFKIYKCLPTYHYVIKFIGYNNKYIFQCRIFNIYMIGRQ